MPSFGHVTPVASAAFSATRVSNHRDNLHAELDMVRYLSAQGSSTACGKNSNMWTHDHATVIGTAAESVAAAAMRNAAATFSAGCVCVGGGVYHLR